MDITNLNFNQLLPEISRNIKECNFIAIDTEMSGLTRERSNNRFDLPDERYKKAVESSRGYFIMQFGLSCFTKVAPLHYSNSTYNFYIFPQAVEGYGDIDRTFSIQAHAIQFLSEHAFDFNKLFKHGVSYLTFGEKKSLTAKLKAENKARAKVELDARGLPKFVPTTMTDSCRDWLKAIKGFVKKRKAFYAGDKTVAPSNNETITSDEQMNVDGDRNTTGDTPMSDESGNHPDSLELKNCSTRHKMAILRKALEVQTYFENLEISTRNDPLKNETYLVVNYIDKVVKEDKEKTALVTAKGFLEILELVILNKKPLVGHNLALDLIQIINQFMEPLTDDYNSFKEICHSLFPSIYDTKYIAHTILDPETLTNNQSRLNDLYCQCRDSDTLPKIKIDYPDQIFNDKQLPHQAGYDAYMSGYCFLVLCEAYLLEEGQSKSKKRDEPTTRPLSIVEEHQIVIDFCNKIHLAYSYDFKYFNLSGDEEEPDRQHVFYLEHPASWTLDDLMQVFGHFGGAHVSRIDSTSTLCALKDTKNVGAVVKKADKLRGSDSNYKIITYDTYLEKYKNRET